MKRSVILLIVVVLLMSGCSQGAAGLFAQDALEAADAGAEDWAQAKPAANPAAEPAAEPEPEPAAEPAAEAPANIQEAQVGTAQTDGYITEGTYTIRTFYGVKVVNLSGKSDAATDKNKTNVMMWTSTDSNMQTFRIERIQDNACHICPLASAGGYGRVLDVYCGGTAGVGDNIDLWEAEQGRVQRFIIKEVFVGAYAILLADDTSLAMTCEDIDTNNANLYLDTFTGCDEQLFAFIPKGEPAAAPDTAATWEQKLKGSAPVGYIGTKYSTMGRPAEVFVEPDQGILFSFNGIYLMFDGPSRMDDWYGEYFDAERIPMEVVDGVMTGSEPCIAVHFHLRDAGLTAKHIPDRAIVGEKQFDELYYEYAYVFDMGGRSYTLYCDEDGSVDGDSYCIVDG